MTKPKSILLQTTIPFDENDWHIGRFSLLTDVLRSQKGEDGNDLYKLVTRNREVGNEGVDPVLKEIDSSDFDQLWLFAVDMGDGLTTEECSAITSFSKRGGGILSARDHNDLGSSLCTLGGVGTAHYFHSKQREPDDSRHRRDDDKTLNIDWPNYHSGANGNFQRVVADDHELMKRSDGSPIEYFPAHPHEGAVGAPADDLAANVVAKSKSLATGREFNLVVAFDAKTGGRAVAHSSFHHLADYNWNPKLGCPTFLEESPGDEYKTSPEKLNDIKQYVANAARWLSRS